MKRTLATGILLALVGGILIASVGATKSEPSAASVTVPDSRVGDRVVFRTFTKEIGSSEWTQAATETLVIDAVGQTLDADGRPLDALVTRTNMTAEQYASTSSTFIDLVTRSAVRTEFKSDSMLPGLEFDLTHTFFEHAGGPPYFSQQGRTYTVGQDLTDEPAPAIPEGCRGGGAGAGWGGSSGPAGLLPNRGLAFHVSVTGCGGETDSIGFEMEDLGLRVLVVQAGQVEGRDAVDVRAEGAMRFPSEIPSPPEFPGAFDKLEGAIIAFTHDVWMSSEVPYPVLRAYHQKETLKDGTVSESDTVTVLETYESGKTDVPWKSGGLPPIPAPERSEATSYYPADGKATKLAYPLSRALADVTGPASPPAFRLWLTRNPQARLVSAELQVGENSRDQMPTQLWHIVYALPTGAAHEVSTESFGGAPLILDHGDRTVPAYEASWLIPSQVTISQVEAYWSATNLQKYVSVGPNFVHWGFELNYAQGPACLGDRTHDSDHNRFVELHQIYFGYSTEGSCQQAPPQLEASVLAVDTMTPTLLGAFQFRDDWDVPGSSLLPGDPQLPEEKEGKGFALSSVGFREPDVKVAAIASTSLFAVFLAVYFFPVLKFVGAQTLLLVPGYAKLRKEELMDNKVRDQLLEVVKQNPGLSVTELGKRVDAGWGTVVYHLGVLEKNKILSSVIDGRNRRVFPVGLVDWSAQGQLALLQNGRVRQLYDLIHEEPGTIQEELARRVGISAPAAFWHLKRLENAGLVGCVKKGRRNHYYANEAPKLPAHEGIEVA